jgi:CubicO group peptidase (beta-lactamase class C family)
MSNTTWDEPVGPWARPHHVRDGVVVAEGFVPLSDGEIAPMGGLWSTVSDLARWVSWLDEANTGHDARTGKLRASSRREMQAMHTYVGQSALDSESAPSGYGFGLLVRDDRVLGHVVGHSGGLPGYGSNMRWVKGTGVGVIGLANVTYAPMSTFTHRALTELHRAGLVVAQTVDPSHLLCERASALVDVLSNWSDQVARSLFADNVESDESFDRRADDARSRTGGELVTLIGVRATSRTSGTAMVSAGLRTFEIEFSLSPVRALIQEYSWKEN